MSDDTGQVVLLRTKLHRPPIPADHVPRAGLLERLTAAGPRPTILVSAPAGYGKSTLVASWLEGCGRPGAWLSLDEHDNDLRRFLDCFLAAIRTAVPGATAGTRDLLASPTLPPVPVLAATFVNDLVEVKTGLVVVLDDLHCLRDRAVHEFLGLVLRRPPDSLQLVLVGRRDPALPVATLRAGGMLTEVRMQDLRFTGEEAVAFLQATSDRPVDAATAAELIARTEGWVTGLRLAVLAMRGHADGDKRLADLKGTTRYIVDYLVGDVLEQQPAGVRSMLLATSVLERFCAPLCDALGGMPPAAGAADIDGRGFISWLQSHNLFVVPLDQENHWFRYHHLFGELLRGQLERHVEAGEIADLRLRASAWCEDQGQLEEAILLALAADDAATAADIVERHCNAEYDEDRWFVVDRWLELLPREIKEQRPRLLLTEARVLNDRFRLAEIPPLVGQAQALLEREPGTPLDQAELLYFQGFLQFWAGDGASGQSVLEEALVLLPDDCCGYVRGQIELFIGLNGQIRGQVEEAADRLAGWIRSRDLRTGTEWERLQFGLVTLALMNGDLPGARREGRVFLDDGRRTGKAFILSWADYLLGVVAFHAHDTGGVRRHFGRVVEHKYAANTRAAVDALAGLAVIAQLDGRTADVEPFLTEAHELARWAGDSGLDEVVRACAARISLLRGGLDAAERWQRGFSMPAHVPGMIFFLAHPCVTECRVLAARGTDTSLEEAARKLRDLRAGIEAVHLKCQLVDVMILEVMVAARRGLREQALDLLQETVELVGPRGWLRPFVEQGPPLGKLLEELKDAGRATDLVESILAALPAKPARGTRVQMLIEPLSHRELDVLELLAGRLQNKEIAAELSISPVTVKSHLRTIYQKLDVANRREAVEKASRLRIVD